MSTWSPGDWGIFFAALSANVVLIIHALASWLGRKESRDQNRQILEQVSEVKGKIDSGEGGQP
jgi:hypothetical protein